jgi:hypothetical protein
MKVEDLVPIVLSSTSITLAVGAFFYRWNAQRKQHNAARSLVPLWMHATAAGGIPTAIALVVCSFKPGWLILIPGLNLPIALGGLSLLYVCLESLGNLDAGLRIKEENRNNLEEKSD